MQHEENAEQHHDQQHDQHAKLQIILVDGDKESLRRMHTALFEIKYEWVASLSAEQVVRQVKKNPYAAVVVGAKAGNVPGPALLRRLGNVAPNTMRLLVVDERMAQHKANQALELGEAHHLLRLDAEKSTLRGIVDRAIHTYRMKQSVARFKAANMTLKQELKEQERAVCQANRRIDGLKQEVETLQEAASTASMEAQNRFKESLGILTKLQALQNPSLTQHMMRVAKVSMQIGQQMDLGKDTLFQLEIGAMLHDVGKLVLSPSILEVQPHQLDPIAQKKYRAHVEIGEDLVGKITNLEVASTFVRGHHERYDGKGFPDKLKADQIPVGARIIAVANVFDKLCFQSTRRMEPRQAYETIRRRAESHFDPRVINIMGTIVRQMSNAKKSTGGLNIG